MTTHYQHLESPIGRLLLTADSDAITGVYMNEHKDGASVGADWVNDETPVLAQASHELAEYFAGVRQVFTVAVVHAHGTAFQQGVWRELRRIAFGTTVSYGEIARRLGDAGAARAVGAANGRNPVSIIVPCHRVVGASGKLTGYAGGESRKAFLLAHEAGAATLTL